MKIFLKKCFICLAVTLLTLSCFGCTSVNAVQPRAYFVNGPYHFSGYSSSVAHNYDGNYMAMEVKATSSSGASHQVKVHVFLYDRNITETYTFYSNGNTYKFDYIYLGNSGSCDVVITFQCSSSDTITAEMTSYSWYT